MKTYSVTRFQSLASTSKNAEPFLIWDVATWLLSLTEPMNTGFDADTLSKIEGLKTGESTVFGNKGSRFTLEYGYRVKALPDFAMNAVRFDSHAKELVIVSNGSCLFDHDNTEAYRLTHPNNRPCEYRASEAIAVRPVLGEKGIIELVFTYRAVNPCNLEQVSEESAQRMKELFEAAKGRV